MREGLRLRDLWVWGNDGRMMKSGWRSSPGKMLVEEHMEMFGEEKLSMLMWLMLVEPLSSEGRNLLVEENRMVRRRVVGNSLVCMCFHP